MDKPRIIKSYLQYLEKGFFSELVSLFTPDAFISTPLYERIEVKEFYKLLFQDTASSKITLKNIFNSLENPNTAAVQFIYELVKKDGTSAKFECMNVMEFLPGTNKIHHLTGF